YVAARDIARYARGRAFPLIPCTLCGSQENLQRVAVRKMLERWEREFPGRTESIFSALRNVEPEHLADPRRFDFAGLEARRVAPAALAPYDAELPVSVVYLRFPVPDHGIPAEPARMAEILDCLGAALRAGRTIYLHCRAGIGRTGMVAGCVLLEQGRSGDAALAELNRLWQHSGRAPLWPWIPETLEQTEYVRSWARPAFSAR